MDTIWIYTEERPKINEISLILLKMNIEHNICDIHIKPIKNAIHFCVENISVNVFIYIVSGSSSFVDYLVYQQETKPIPNDVPIMILESTKNNIKEAGNMWYQRIVKFVNYDALYPNNTTKKILLYNTQIKISAKTTSTTWNIGCRLCATLGVEVILFENNYVIDVNPYKSLEDLADHINSTRKKSGCVNNRILLEENSIEIHSNLNKNNELNHDPNKGFVIGVSAVIRQLDKNIPILIANHMLPETAINSKKLNNKFFYGLKKVGNVKIDKFDVNWDNIKFPKSYYKLDVTGEKIVSIVIDIVMSYYNFGFKILFTNHAGCEKEYLKIDNTNIIIPKKVQLLDMAIEDEDHIYFIEAEMSKNANNGIKQLDTFDEFEKIIKAYRPNKTIKRNIVLYGGDHTESIFSIDKNNMWINRIKSIDLDLVS
jgi:hypothetical protein